MSQYEGSLGERAGQTASVARDETANVGQHAREAGGQVVQTATEQARQVVAESGRQARDLLGEAQGQARDQASAQKQRAAQRMHEMADEFGQLAGNNGNSGMAAELARQAASRLHGAASWLDSREPADLLEEARSFARRRPGTFLLAAAAAGLAAGRLTRGLAAGSNGTAGGNGAVGSNGAAGGNGRARDVWQPAATAGQDYPAATYAAGVADPASAASYPESPAMYPAGAGNYQAGAGGYPAEPAAYPDDTAVTAAYPADTIAYPAEPGTGPDGGTGPANRPYRPGQAPRDEEAQW